MPDVKAAWAWMLHALWDYIQPVFLLLNVILIGMVSFFQWLNMYVEQHFWASLDGLLASWALSNVPGGGGYNLALVRNAFGEISQWFPLYFAVSLMGFEVSVWVACWTIRAFGKWTPFIGG